MLRQEVRRERDFGRVVVNRKIIGDDVRIVRRIEGHVAKKRRALRFLEKVNHRIGESGAGMFALGFRRSEPAADHVTELHFQRIAHAAHEDGLGDLKTFRQRAGTIVPFAGHERGVTHAAEGGRPGFITQQLLINAEQRTPGQKHGAGRHAGGGVQSALHVSAVES